MVFVTPYEMTLMRSVIEGKEISEKMLEVKVSAKTLDRKGKSLLISITGKVEAFYK